MEEGTGVQAPVTRLRRRLSLEQSDDVKSPGPATPTKKRGGRLAAKPQLDLIEENAPTPGSATKRSSRKAAVKEISEAEEKPVTPMRRSTRIKSNTSIVSETTLPFDDTPRAKRAAARRTSQVGSDSESSVTPAIATRRTRKDSASSVEKLEVTLASKPNNITEIIIEETESSSLKSDDATKSNENTTEITPTRKSPRLKEKKTTEKKLMKGVDNSSNSNEIDSNNTSRKNEFNNSKQNEKSQSVSEVSEVLENKNALSPEKPEENVFNASHTKMLHMIKELDKKPRRNTSNLNKSTSALETNSFKSQRQRTKSFTNTSSHTHVDERMFYSDNESVKIRYDKNKALKQSKNESMHMGSGDHLLNKTGDEKSIVQNIEKKTEHNLSVQKKSPIESSFSTAKARKSEGIITPSKSLNISNSVLGVQTISPEGNKENIQTTKNEDERNECTKFFTKTPTAILQSTVFFEDADTDSKGKEIHVETEDQCVPVVNNELVEDRVSETLGNDQQSKNNSVLNKTNDKNLVEDSCEPMDIDETIPNNISVTDFSQNKSNQICDDQGSKGLDKSVSNSPLINNTLNKSSNHSKRKSSLTISDNLNLDKTEHENKSTLILSQIKDVSSTEHNTMKSPKACNELLSTSVNSVRLVNDNAIDKKNLSQDYSTSTPLQQKKIQKLAMQINSSIIDTLTIENKKSNNKSKNELSQISKSPVEPSDDDSEDEVDSSRPNNSLLDDEAEVASDDYESGDSQDDDEREYEKINEIVQRGETLDSDDDVSNDTDYEKDSFVVSSDKEDYGLLSGSRDDLSMSDNELTMSKKSKNKYNERKLKDQKKASREMYEARHKLNTSEASLKSRKYKRQKIESSEESSDEETIAPVKRTKLRLDSTQDESLNCSSANDSKLKKNSKRERLSKSVCDENANTEHEITVYGENTQCHDPLSVQVKPEPKTPMKDMDILSTVQINENIEEVLMKELCIENNVSVLKSSETIDPLQATMLEADSSSISENSDIVNNYDNVLKELNNEKPNALKLLDTSLNLNKKTKQNKQPIIDQLNITNPKKSKQNKTTIGNDVVDSAYSKKPQTKIDLYEGSSSSNSIDLQLLFSEDSNDVDTSKTSKKCLENKEEQDIGETEDYIPLKRTPGKINILIEPKQQEPTEGHTLNESVQNKKRRSKGPIEIQAAEIIDKSLSTSLNTNTKKKKNKKNNVTLNDGELSVLNVTIDAKDEDAPEEISYESKKSKKKNRKPSETHVEEEPSKEELSMNISLNVNGAEKKKKKLSESQNEHTLETSADTPYVDTNVSIGSAKKQKNKNNSQIATEDIGDSAEVSIKVMTDSTKKKKKKLSLTLENEVNETKDETPNISIGSTNKKKLKVKSENEPLSVEETNINIEEKTSEKLNKKKRKSSDQDKDNVNLEVANNSDEDAAPEKVVSTKTKKKNRKSSERHLEEDEDAPEEISYKSTKSKKKNRKPSETHVEEEPSKEELSMNISLHVNSAKKKKRKLSESQNEHTLETSADTPYVDTNVSIGSAKKQKNKNNSQIATEGMGDIAEQSIRVMTDSTKKKKKKLSVTLENEVNEIKDETPNISTGSRKKKKLKVKSENEPMAVEETNINIEKKTSENLNKKKRKSSDQDKDNVNLEGQIPQILDELISGSQKKKRKISQNDDYVQISDAEPKKKNKKRKERDDDVGNNVSKIFKENSFDDVHVTRLPASIINKLDEKPKKGVLEIKKSSVVSTTSFAVETARKRRNKPSTFLEESVYLNDTHTEKKKKANIKKPKVLPFIPTAVTSGSGFTTNFKINVLPQEVQFVAQSTNVANFKNDYLYNNKIKRLGTYETYKKHRSTKMSKF